MRLFGSFFVIFLVIFSVVLVVTGEWENRVQPALRKVIVQRIFGIEETPPAVADAAATDGTGEGAEADSTATLATSILADQGIEDESGELVAVIAALEKIYDEILAEQAATQLDSLRYVREQMTDMTTRITALEAQLRLLRAARDQGESDAWKALGKVFASMRAEEASQIIAYLPESQAVQLLSAMNPRNSAELMGKLEPGRAARLSGRLSNFLRDLQTEANLQ